MRRAVALAALLAAACAQPLISPSHDAASLAQAERAFAADSVRTDMRDAFLKHFAPDGVFLLGGWVNARETLRDRPAPAVTLDWTPRHVEVAASGELGLSTGPWIRTSRARPELPPAFGDFVSIWRRQPDGAWQVEVDIGISHGPEPDDEGPLDIIEPGSAATHGEALEDAEARFVKASLAQGVRAAYAADALPRLLLYRDGAAPLRGKDSALASRALPDDKVLWLVDRLEVSHSRDFGYVRGSYADAAEPARVRGYFLRVWRREGGHWGIALDVTNPAR